MSVTFIECILDNLSRFESIEELDEGIVCYCHNTRCMY